MILKSLRVSRTILITTIELQEDINNLIRWSQDWQMLFNVDKCKVMHFGRTNESLSYYMNGTKLDKVTEEKDLGVWISIDLKASQQCVQACSKANRILGVLNRTIKCKDDSNLCLLYTSPSPRDRQKSRMPSSA